MEWIAMNTFTHKRDPHGLHEKAIQAAMQLISERKPTGASIQEVAIALGEPEEKLSALFENDKALLVACTEHALIILMDTCTKAVVKVNINDPISQFVALGEAYTEWALRFPVQYKISADANLIDPIAEPTLNRYLQSIADLMFKMLSRAQDEGHIHPEEDITMLALVARCFVSGVTRMVVDNRLTHLAPDHDQMELARAMIRDFVKRMARSS